MKSAEFGVRVPIEPAGSAVESSGRGGWRPLFSCFRASAFRFDWHDFESEAPVDWSGRLQTGGMEICFNLGGRGVLESGGVCWHLSQRTVAIYWQGDVGLTMQRLPGERHRFIVVALSRAFLALHLSGREVQLDPLVRKALQEATSPSAVAPVQRMSGDLLQFVDSLRHPPVFAPAQELWFEGKALEAISLFLFRPPEGELFCTRAQRAACERAERARQILTERMGEPPSLEDLGRQVGCSPFYLSRCFTQQMGMTLQQYLRRVRLERAAELLRTGRCNVTEAAFEVGYNSISHFSKAFRERFGCRPGRYGPQAPAGDGSVGENRVT
jgi:AraC family transcriptional regulator